MGKEVNYNEAVVDYLYNEEYSDIPKEKFLEAIKSNKEVVDYLYKTHYSDSDYDKFLSSIGYTAEVKKKEVLDSPSESSPEPTPSPSKKVGVNDLPLPPGFQDQSQQEFNPADFQSLVEKKKQKDQSKLESQLYKQPVVTQQTDAITPAVPAEELVQKDTEVRNYEKLAADRIETNKDKYDAITKGLEDKIRNIPASELPNVYEAFDDKTKEFLDFQTRIEKDAFIEKLLAKREEVLDTQVKNYMTSELEEFTPTDEGISPEVATQLAKEKQKEANLTTSLSRIQEYTRLSGDALVEFKNKVSEYNKLLSGGGTLSQEQLTRLNELREDIKKVTEIEGEFYDPITGKVSPEYTKEVLETQAGLEDKYNNDYTKMSERSAYLASKLRMLEKEALDLAEAELGYRPEEDPLGVVRRKANYQSWSPEDHRKKAAAQETLETYKETLKEFDALNRALLLNEDPSKVQRGFWSAAGEGFAEDLLGIEVVTDNDYRKGIIPQAMEAGVNIDEEKSKVLQDTFIEELGATVGSSVSTGLKIAATSAITGGIGSVAGSLARTVPYVNRAIQIAQTNKKAAKLMDKAYDIIKSGVDFELASDQTSFAMGVGEKTVADAVEVLGKKLAGGKLGAFANLFTRVGGRIVGGTAEEYAGDLADNLSEFGFTPELIEETFGSGEEGLRKLYLIMASAGGFGLPTEVGAFYKNKLSEIKSKKASGEAVSESDLELESYIYSLLGDVTQTSVDAAIGDDNSEITTEKIEILKEAGIDIESEPIVEGETKTNEEVTVEEEVELTPEEELVQLAERYKQDPEAVKQELGITEEEVTTEPTTQEGVEPTVTEETVTPTVTEETVTQVETEPTVTEEVTQEDVTPTTTTEETVTEVKTEPAVTEDVTEKEIQPEDIVTDTTEEVVETKETVKVNPKPKSVKTKSTVKLESQINKLKSEIKQYTELIASADPARAAALTALMNQAKNKLAKLEAKMPTVSEKVDSFIESVNETEQVKSTEPQDLTTQQSEPTDLKSELSEEGEYWQRRYGGEAFEINDESGLGLVRAFNSLREVVYIPYKKGIALDKNIEKVKPTKDFTAEDVAKLQQLHNELKLKDQKELDIESPFEKEKSNIIFSDSVPRSERVLVESLLTAFGLDGIKVAILDKSDLTNKSLDKMGFFGLYKSVRSFITDFSREDLSGNIFKIKPGEYIINISNNLTPEQRFQTLSHELGHLLQFEKFDNAPQEVQQKVIDEYKNWLSKQKGKTEAEVLLELKAIASLEANLANSSTEKVANLNSGFFAYLTSFKEFFAENVSEYVSSGKKPKSVLDKFFHSIYEGLLKIYNKFKRNSNNFPKLEEWLDSVFDSEKAKSVINKYSGNESKSLKLDTDVDIYSKLLQDQGIEKSVADKMAAQFVENQKKKSELNQSKKDLVTQAETAFKEALKNEEREFAAEAAYKVLDESDLYKSLEPEEQQKIKDKIDKLTSYKPKAEKSTEPVIETTKKQILLDKLKNLKEGAEGAIKDVKETRKELAQIIKGLQPDLTKEQYRQLIKVLQKTNTKADLNTAVTQIDNIVRYGKANPTTADIIRGEVEATEEFTQDQISELVFDEIERNNKIVKSEDRKAIKQLIKDLNLTAQSLGKVSGQQVINLIKAMKKIDLSNTEDLAKLRGILEKNRSKATQTKLKKAFEKNKIGNRGSLASRLMNVDPNYINDYDSYNSIAEALINSVKNNEFVMEGKTYNATQMEAKISELEKEAAQNKKDLEVAREQIRLTNLEKTYKKSPLARSMSFDDYVEFVDGIKSAAAQTRIDDKLNELADRKEELKQILKDSKSRLQDYINNNPNISSGTKKMVESLIKFLSSDSNIESLVGDRGKVNKLTKDLLQGIEEIVAFNSTAAVTNIAAVANAINKAQELPKLGNIFRNKFVKLKIIDKIASLDTTITFLAKNVELANEFIAEVLSDFQASSSRARFAAIEFNKEVERLVSRAKMSEQQSQLMGMVSFLSQENDKWYTFEQKKAIIEGQIAALGENNRYKKYEKILKETYAKLKDFNSLEELNKALEGDTLFNEKEKDVLTFVRDKFAEIEPKLRESNYNNKGVETESYSNYAPLYTHTVGEKGELGIDAQLEDPMFMNKLDTKESSRTISRRKSTPGNVMYNFDFVETSKAGMNDTLYDIETLFDRKTLANLMQTPEYRSLFGTGEKSISGKDVIIGSTFDMVNQRIKSMANKKKPSKPSDRSKSDVKLVTKYMNTFLRNLVAFPLKNSLQIVKQTFPIAKQTVVMLANHPVKFLSSLADVNTDEFLNSEFYKSSASGSRLAGGEVALDKAGTPVASLLRKLGNPEGRGNLASRTYENLVSEVLTSSDNWINRVTLLSFYKIEAEKAGIPVDLNNPDLKLLSKAQTEANRINNVSDPSEMGDLFSGLDKDAQGFKLFAQAFYLYKSFAVNASLNAMTNVRNIFANTNDKNKLKDIQRLTGAIAGAVVFTAIGQLTKDLIKKNTLDLLDIEDDEDDKSLGETFIEISAKGIFDLFTGFTPNFSESGMKKVFNKIYGESYEAITGEELLKDPMYVDDEYNIAQLTLLMDYVDRIEGATSGIMESDLTDKQKGLLLVNLLGYLGMEGNIKIITDPAARKLIKQHREENKKK